jgi:phosphohistidine phosphatase
MRLYIVRHGIAVPHGTPGVAEDERPLIKDGIRKMKAAAAGLRTIKCIPELILSSPLPRARQTADIVLHALGKDIPLEETASLAPSGSRPDFYAELQKRRKAGTVMIVGHQPSLGEIAGEIAFGSAERYLELKKRAEPVPSKSKACHRLPAGHSCGC